MQIGPSKLFAKSSIGCIYSSSPLVYYLASLRVLKRDAVLHVDAPRVNVARLAPRRLLRVRVWRFVRLCSRRQNSPDSHGYTVFYWVSLLTAIHR